MPTYEYQCKECGSIREEFHSINSSPEVFCKTCNKLCEKIFSSSGNFVLKGDGWTSYNSKIKNEMTKKNQRMKTKMNEREKSGEGVTSLK